MPNQIKFILLSLIAGFVISSGIALAQETSTADAIQELNLDTSVTAQDLEVSEPGILPDSPIYFLKNWSRGIQQFFTFDAVKKAELNLRFTNEKLLEAQKITEKTSDAETIKKAADNYQKELEKLKTQTEKIKDKADQNKNVGKFLDKFIKQQTLQRRILDKLETQVPTGALEKIKTAREEHLQNFGEVMTRLDNKDAISKRLETNIENIKGSDFVDFKNLEFLKKVEEKAPEAAKEAFRTTQENILNKFRDKLEKITPEQQEKIKTYIEKISGENEKRIEILDGLKTAILNATQTTALTNLKKKLDEGRENILKKIGPEKSKEQIEKAAQTIRKVEELIQEKSELANDGDISQLLKNAKIHLASAKEAQKNEKYGEAFGQANAALQNAENALRKIKKAASGKNVCTAELKNVCGKDGKNYTNESCAKAAGTEVDHEGNCEVSVKLEKIKGAINGKITIGPLCPVEPCQSQQINPYAERQVILEAQNNEKTIKIKFDDASGNFHKSDIPAGNYKLTITKCEFMGCKNVLPKEVIIKANATTDVNIDIDTGIR